MDGTSTPLSPSSTVASSLPSPATKPASLADEKVPKRPTLPASTAVEYIASRSELSSNIFIYDLAEQAGFGALTKSWANATSGTASVVNLQTRNGAGLSLAGRLSQGTSKDAARGAAVTAYTTPTGLASMAQSLSYLPPAQAGSRLVLQVPNVTPVGENFGLSPTLSGLTTALTILPTNFAVLLSAEPQEAVDLAAASYQISKSHVIHLFDHHSTGREIGNTVVTPHPSELTRGLSIDAALAAAGYSFFDYAGDREAHTVVVLLNGPLALAAKAFAARVPGLGVVSVRVLRPWNEDALRQVLPAGVKSIHVLDDVPTELTQGPLYVDVFSTLLDPTGSMPSISGHRIVPSRTQEFVSKPREFLEFLQRLVPGAPTTSFALETPSLKKLLFFSTPGTPLSGVPHIIEDTFTGNPTIKARISTEHDVFSRQGGIAADRLLLSSKTSADDFVPGSLLIPLQEDSEGEANLVAVLDSALLKSHSLLRYARAGSPILVVTSWTPAEFATNLPAETIALVRERGLRIYAFDAQAMASKLSATKSATQEALQAALVHLAFLRLYLAGAAKQALVQKIASLTFGDAVADVELTKANESAWQGLVEVDLSVEFDAEPSSAPLKHFHFNAVAVEADGETVVNGARLASWHDAAKCLLFPAACVPVDPTAGDSYSQNPALHPELPERTFLVTCTVNRRLTPLEYDRNVFHLEFDTSRTGLKYEIGEALGVHGWNDEQEVLDFCTWYGVDPARLVTLPVPGDDSRMHTRTVFQILQQQIDLFGRPGKAFYTDLAEFAAGQVDKYALRFIGSPEGASTFKKLGEKETVTFADVLRRFPTARPSIEVLCTLIGDIKPRHYSIASSQAVVGDRVDLLVVSVDWVTPSGSPRYGQCTRYLAGLKPGQKVTVSIKPSVMKLPPDNRQPLILAGLGTGAAPFRAFLQHRAWLASQGHEIGPVYYYFGSRHQSQEYLYGEEIEAFILDGTITRAGLAFSRDGPKKVYIQHKMGEDAQDLARMLHDEQGVFYLCGPTWPVGDIYEALVDAFGRFQGMNRETAGAYLEELKEEERYVLEVY